MLACDGMKHVASQYDGYVQKLVQIGAMEGLSADQRQMLADFVLAGARFNKIDATNSQWEKWQCIDAERRPAQLRKLTGKLEKARTALNEVRDQVEAIGNSGNVILAEELQESVLPFVDEAIASITAGSPNDAPSSSGDRAESSPGSLSVPDPVKQQAEEKIWKSDHERYMTSRLVSFFVDICGLAKNEAYLRVAKIGNAILGWNLATQEEYDGVDGWKGSDAIRKRYERLDKERWAPLWRKKR